MRKVLFHDDSFAIHGITGPFMGKVSAWFDANGNVVNAEQLLPNGTERPVRQSGPIWNRLKAIGRVWKDNTPAVAHVPRSNPVIHSESVSLSNAELKAVAYAVKRTMRWMMFNKETDKADTFELLKSAIAKIDI